MKIKKFAALCSLTVCCFSLISIPAAASMISEPAIPAIISEKESVVPCADVLQWQYKVEDGKLYKRLYNNTTGNWVGDWIYVADVN